MAPPGGISITWRPTKSPRPRNCTKAACSRPPSRGQTAVLDRVEVDGDALDDRDALARRPFEIGVDQVAGRPYRLPRFTCCQRPRISPEGNPYLFRNRLRNSRSSCGIASQVLDQLLGIRRRHHNIIRVERRLGLLAEVPGRPASGERIAIRRQIRAGVFGGNA